MKRSENKWIARTIMIVLIPIYVIVLPFVVLVRPIYPVIKYGESYWKNVVREWGFNSPKQTLKVFIKLWKESK